jgi:hypothetical protein
MLLEGQEFSNEVSLSLFKDLANLSIKAEQVTYWKQRMVSDVCRACNYHDRTCQSGVYDSFPELKNDLQNHLMIHKRLVYQQLLSYHATTVADWITLLKQGFRIASSAQAEMQQRLNLDADKA